MRSFDDYYSAHFTSCEAFRVFQKQSSKYSRAVEPRAFRFLVSRQCAIYGDLPVWPHFPHLQAAAALLRPHTHRSLLCWDLGWATVAVRFPKTTSKQLHKQSVRLWQGFTCSAVTQWRGHLQSCCAVWWILGFVFPPVTDVSVQTLESCSSSESFWWAVATSLCFKLHPFAHTYLTEQLVWAETKSHLTLQVAHVLSVFN